MSKLDEPAVTAPKTPTNKRPKRTRVALITAIATIVCAVVAILALASRDDSDSGARTTQKANDGAVICNASGAGNTVKCDYRAAAEDAKARTENQVIADAENYRNSAPSGDGPWPFQVVRTNDIGLKVRTTNVALGQQIGGLGPLQIAWVMCQQKSGFEPEPGNGDIWYKLKWSQTKPSTDYFTSDYSAPHSGWAYAHYLVPVNQNGEVPTCSE